MTRMPMAVWTPDDNIPPPPGYGQGAADVQRPQSPQMTVWSPDMSDIPPPPGWKPETTSPASRAGMVPQGAGQVAGWQPAGTAVADQGPPVPVRSGDQVPAWFQPRRKEPTPEEIAQIESDLGMVRPGKWERSQEEVDAAIQASSWKQGDDDDLVHEASRRARLFGSLPKPNKNYPAESLPVGTWFIGEAGEVYERTAKGNERVSSERIHGEAMRQDMALFAQERLKESWFPRAKSTAVQTGADAAAKIQRVLGYDEAADKTVRFGSAFGAAAEPYHQQSWIPVVSKAVSGASRTLPSAVVAGAAAGPYGAIADATATEANNAITAGRDAGLQGRELASYVVREGVIEAAPAIVMQRIGLGGVEKVLGGAGRQAVNQGVANGLKKAGVTLLQELPEELVTEVGHSVNQALSGVDPKALSAKSLRETITQTVAQTVLTVGAVESPSLLPGGVPETGNVSRYIPLPETGDVSRKQWIRGGYQPELGRTQAERNAQRDSELAFKAERAAEYAQQDAEIERRMAQGAAVQPEPPASEFDAARRAAAGEAVERPQGVSEARWQAMVKQAPGYLGPRDQAPQPVTAEVVPEGTPGASAEAPVTAEAVPEAEVESPGTPAPGGPASPSLVATSLIAPGPYGIKHADVDPLRQQIGMAARQPEAPYTDQQAMDDAMARSAADVDLAIARIGAGKGDGKLDNAMLLRRRVELGNALEDAVARGDTVAQQAVTQELVKWAEADTVGGTKEGRGLQSRKMMADNDFSLSGLTVKAIKAKNGAAPTQAEAAKLQEIAAAHAAEMKTMEADRDAERQRAFDAEEKLAEIDAEKSRKAKRSRAAAKAEETKAARRRELYDAAEQAGVGAKALEERAREILDSDPTVQFNRAYNAARSMIQQRTGLTPLVISQYENRTTKEQTGIDRGKKPKTIYEHNRLDTKAPEIRREFSDFIDGDPNVDDATAVVDFLRAPKKPDPDWRDHLEAAAESLKIDTASFNPDDFGAGEGEADLGGEAGAPAAGGKKPLRKGEKKAVVAKKKEAAFNRLKLAWESMGHVGAVYDPQAEAQKQAELTLAALDAGRALLEDGVVRLSEFLANVRDVFAQDWDQVRPHMIDAWHQLRASGEAPSPMADAEDRAELGRLARKMHREFIEAGVPDRESRVDAVWEELKLADPAITRRETMDAISGYGDFRELSKDEVSIEARKDRGELQQIAKLDDMKQGNAPAKTGVERRTPSDEERRLQKEVNEAKKRGGYTTTDPAKQLQTSFKTAETSIRNRMEDLREALRTGEAIPEGTKPTYSAQQQAKLETMRKELDELTKAYRRLHPTKTQQSKMDRAADKAALAEMENEGGATDVKTQQQRIMEAAKVLDGIAKRMQADLDALKKEGWKKKTPGEKLTSPMLEAKRAAIEAIKAQRAELLALDPAKQADIEARSDAAYTRALKTRLAKNTARLAEMERTGVIPPKKPVRKLSKEQLETKVRLKAIEADARRVMDRIKWAEATRMQRTLHGMGKAFQGLKTLWGGPDQSFIGRQGWNLAVSHPIQAARAQKRSLKATFSETEAMRIEDEIENDDLFKDGTFHRMKLELPGIGEDVGVREEDILAEWPENIPWYGRVVKGSNRGFLAQGNQQRVAAAKAMLNSLLKHGPAEASVEELEIIGHYINAATWRGDMGKFAQAAVALNDYFYTPRGYVGQAQFMLGTALWYKHAGKGTSRVRKLIVKEYARGLAGRAVVYGLAGTFLYAMLGPPSDDEEKGWSISFNPMSPDGGKIRIGRRRIDMTGGLASTTRPALRLAANAFRFAGQLVGIEPSKEGQKEMDATASIIERALVSKASPAAGIAIRAMQGKTYEGEKLTAGRLAYETVTPLAFRDVYESMKAWGIPGGVAGSMVHLFGFSGMTYEKKPSKVRKLQTY